ncbi:MAG: hypothetical protein WD100_13780, partial [Tistlia sp.]
MAFLRSQAITLLLIAANLLVLLAAAWVGWKLTTRYETFVTEFQHGQTAELASVASDDMLWNRYALLTADLAQTVSADKELAAGVAAADGAAIGALLEEEFKQGVVTQGRLALLGLSTYTADGDLVAERWTAGAAPASPPNALLAEVAGREGSTRLELLTRGWSGPERPYLTVFAPIGGLRLRGYLAVHVDPLHALRTLDSRLGMAVSLRGPGGAETLATLDNVSFEEGTALDTVVVPLATPEGAPLVDAELSADVSALRAQLS